MEKDAQTMVSNSDSEIIREISEEEFNPKGTLAIALIYFLIVTIMRISMYFVEFANHGPSIMY